uniref:Uncharacterized protein n=1 Tax=Knipowitschia caucasica TaxID=637954 RepID=A0AAV2MNX9_KNICA
MRDNFIIHGLPEQQKETYQDTEQLVKSCLKIHLKMDSTVKEIQLARAHRLGQWRGKTPRGRPFVGEHGELKGTGLGLTDQFPGEIMRRRKLLQPVLAEARAAGRRAKISIDKLYIDGKLYFGGGIK